MASFLCPGLMFWQCQWIKCNHTIIFPRTSRFFLLLFAVRFEMNPNPVLWSHHNIIYMSFSTYVNRFMYTRKKKKTKMSLSICANIYSRQCGKHAAIFEMIIVIKIGDNKITCLNPNSAVRFCLRHFGFQLFSIQLMKYFIYSSCVYIQIRIWTGFRVSSFPILLYFCRIPICCLLLCVCVCVASAYVCVHDVIITFFPSTFVLLVLC